MPPQPNTKCKACGAKAKVIRTEKMTENVNIATYQCQNANCRAIFSAEIVFRQYVLPPLKNSTNKGKHNEKN